jgi:hypothetical protein
MSYTKGKHIFCYDSVWKLLDTPFYTSSAVIFPLSWIPSQTLLISISLILLFFSGCWDKLRDLFSLSGCQQRQEGAREIYSTYGKTSRRKEETA